MTSRENDLLFEIHCFCSLMVSNLFFDCVKTSNYNYYSCLKNIYFPKKRLFVNTNMVATSLKILYSYFKPAFSDEILSS